jgi:hypothetical protein
MIRTLTSATNVVTNNARNNNSKIKIISVASATCAHSLVPRNQHQQTFEVKESGRVVVSCRKFWPVAQELPEFLLRSTHRYAAPKTFLRDAVCLPLFRRRPVSE